MTSIQAAEYPSIAGQYVSSAKTISALISVELDKTRDNRSFVDRKVETMTAMGFADQRQDEFVLPQLRRCSLGH
jgi:hypothetical protein